MITLNFLFPDNIGMDSEGNMTMRLSDNIASHTKRLSGKSPKALILLDKLYYSMIVATLPDPTVLPPSRYLNSVFCSIFYAFYFGKQRKIVVFVWRIFICMISWHRFGTKITLLLNHLIYMVLAPCLIHHHGNILFAITTKKYQQV